MKKIISVFQRNHTGSYRGRLVRDEVTPGAEWVITGEGKATQKFDGTACMIRERKLFKRYDCRLGKLTPPLFVPCQSARDPVTGHWLGWVPVSKDKPEDKYHCEAFVRLQENPALVIDGTYELIGPKIQGNPEDRPHHVLVPHGKAQLFGCLRDFDGIRNFLIGRDIEGIVWHHPDGRMAKIKKGDFGLKRKDWEK